MANYYVAFDSNHADGPYSFEELEALYKEGKILSETLVCPEECQEWILFEAVYNQNHSTQKTESHPKKNIGGAFLNEREEKRAWLKIQELNEQLETRESDAERFLKLCRTVEGIFRIVGIIALIAGCILFSNNVKTGQTEIGFIYLFSGAFSCLGSFWCAKVLTLLQKIADKK